jgi:hypothetical protein
MTVAHAPNPGRGPAAGRCTGVAAQAAPYRGEVRA